MSELNWWVQQGDSAEVLGTIPTASVDALVTDPPAGIGFMGKEWDDFRRQRNPNDAGRDSVMGRLSRSGPEYGRRDRQHFVEWLASILAECRRVMKPGAYGWVWAIPRTAHWTATACEDAGFAVRDVLVHTFGTGFPKSRSLLKPASEHWILIKAPGELRELRIDENRLGFEARSNPPKCKPSEGWVHQNKGEPRNCVGRWPANFALSHDDKCVCVGTKKVKNPSGSVSKDVPSSPSTNVYGDRGRVAWQAHGDAEGNETVEEWRCTEGCPVKMLDEQSGFSQSPGKTGRGAGGKNGRYGAIGAQGIIACPSDSGGASRFFYIAKPSTRERSVGLPEGERNTHTTVKSIALMEHLISLIAAPGDLALDPFCGSGSTGIAAVKKGCRFVGIEQSEEYCEIARRRILYHANILEK